LTAKDNSGVSFLPPSIAFIAGQQLKTQHSAIVTDLFDSALVFSVHAVRFGKTFSITAADHPVILCSGSPYFFSVLRSAGEIQNPGCKTIQPGRNSII